MKVYIVGDKCFHYTESVGQALETLGVDVKGLYINGFNRDRLSLIEYLKYKVNKEQYVSRYYQKNKEIIRKEIDEFKPDIVLNINANYNYEVIDKILLKCLETEK